MFASALSVMSLVKANRVRAIAVTTPKRSRLLPGLPTIAEAGVPGFEATTWHGVLVPAGTPTPIVERLNTEINKMLQTADVRDKLTALGAEIVGGSSKDFADHIRREIPRWATVVKSINVRLD
jgi:tripartite-type tricarboxylate transporter receptor subunit TctC